MQKLSASLAPRCTSYFGIAPRCKARCKLFLILGAKLGATCSALDVQNLMCKSGCQSGSFPLSTHRSRRIFALFRAPSELCLERETRRVTAGELQDEQSQTLIHSKHHIDVNRYGHGWARPEFREMFFEIGG